MEGLVGLVEQFANLAGLLADAAAVTVVLYGVLDAFGRLLWTMAAPGAGHDQRKTVWRRFGGWLLLGLEFELASDIIGSVVSPTLEELMKLGAIAGIRTFLNYFLERDFEKSGGSEGRERTVDANHRPEALPNHTVAKPAG